MSQRTIEDIRDRNTGWSATQREKFLSRPGYVGDVLFLLNAIEIQETPNEATILADFYREVDYRAQVTIQRTGIVAGAHYNAMKAVLAEKGIDV